MVVQGDAKYRLPKGTMPSIVSRRGRYVRNASFRIVLSERRCWTKGMPSIVSRKGQCQVSSPEGDDTLERFVSHRPLRETMLGQETIFNKLRACAHELNTNSLPQFLSRLEVFLS